MTAPLTPDTLTRDEARRWLERTRAGLEDAYNALNHRDGMALAEALIEVIGSATEIQQALEDARLDLEPTTRLLISPRVESFLSGSGAYQTVQHRSANTQGDSPTQLSLMRKILDAPVTRKDGRFYVELTAEEADDLRSYIEAMEAGARDNTWDADGRADLFAATKLLEQMTKAGV